MQFFENVQVDTWSQIHLFHIILVHYVQVNMFENFVGYLQRRLLTEMYIGMEQVEYLTL
jgi:hypothetical protein